MVANGDIRSEADVTRVHEHTGVDGERERVCVCVCAVSLISAILLGVMSARGILDNPGLYAGYDHTPISCVRDWVEIALRTGVTFTLFHHHLMFMLDSTLSKPEKRVFNTLTSVTAVLDYLNEHYGVCSHLT